MIQSIQVNKGCILLFFSNCTLEYVPILIFTILFLQTLCTPQKKVYKGQICKLDGTLRIDVNWINPSISSQLFQNIRLDKLKQSTLWIGKILFNPNTIFGLAGRQIKGKKTPTHINCNS